MPVMSTEACYGATAACGMGDRLSVLLEGLFSVSSLLFWVKAFDLMESGKLDSL